MVGFVSTLLGGGSKDKKGKLLKWTQKMLFQVFNN
jgi:hypothetical protein